MLILQPGSKIFFLLYISIVSPIAGSNKVFEAVANDDFAFSVSIVIGGNVL
jgi:hypothetical protein